MKLKCGIIPWLICSCAHEVCCLLRNIHSSSMDNVVFSTLINAVVQFCTLFVEILCNILLMSLDSPTHPPHVHYHRLYSPGWTMASSLRFRNNIFFFLRGGVVSLTTNLQPGGPEYPFLSGLSPLTCQTSDTLPVAYAY